MEARPHGMGETARSGLEHWRRDVVADVDRCRAAEEAVGARNLAVCDGRSAAGLHKEGWERHATSGAVSAFV